MASLTETAHLLRRGLIFFVLLILAYFVISFGSGFVSGLVSPGGGKKIIKAEVRFGKLPFLHLGGKQATPKSEATAYILETVTGDFPQTPSMLPVFPLQQQPVDILASDEAISLALNLGFPTEPKVLSPTEYLWEISEQTLRMNILTKNYAVNPKYELIFPKGKLTDSAAIMNNAKAAIGIGRNLDASFTDNLISISLLRREGTELKPAPSPMEAEVARVDFFRSVGVDKQEYRLLTGHPQEALVYLLLGGGRGQPFLKNFITWNYDFKRGATYPLRPVRTAWEEIKSGLGTVTLLSGKNGDYIRTENLPEIKTITIRQIEIAYFDEEIMQNFLQPIFVFSGQADLTNAQRAEIIIYTPAVDPAWVVKQ